MHYRWLTFTAVVSVVPAACAWAGQLVIVDDIPGTFMDITASGTILDLGGNDEIVIVTTIGNEIFPSGSVVVANNGGLGFAFPPSNDLPPVNEPIPSTVAFGGGRALLPFWDDIDDKNGDPRRQPDLLVGVQGAHVTRSQGADVPFAGRPDYDVGRWDRSQQVTQHDPQGSKSHLQLIFLQGLQIGYNICHGKRRVKLRQPGRWTETSTDEHPDRLFKGEQVRPTPPAYCIQRLFPRDGHPRHGRRRQRRKERLRQIQRCNGFAFH